MKTQQDKLESIFDHSMFGSVNDILNKDNITLPESDVKQDSKNKGKDLFSNISTQPSNIRNSSEHESYPAMQGLNLPTHLNNPELVTGNGRGGVIATKTINKSASIKKKAFGFLGNDEALRQQLIASVMADPSLDFQTKQVIVDKLKFAPPSTLSRLSSIALGSGAGLAIAKFLLGAGSIGSLLGAAAGGYIANNLYNNSQPRNPFSSNPFDPSYKPNFTNPFTY